MANKSFIASQRTNHAHVERTALLGEIDAELSRAGMVILCAPWGYGKSDLLSDYARIAHARMPLRPLIRVDYGLHEVQAYLHGNHRPLERRLFREARGAIWLGEERWAVQTELSGEEDVLPKRRVGEGLAPPVCLLELCASILAPQWYTRFDGGARYGEQPFHELPLVIIDNVPPLDGEIATQWSNILRSWAREGARILVACTPSAQPPQGLLSDVVMFTGASLAVSTAEMELWVRDLHLPGGFDVASVTAGVPFLVDACRTAGADNPAYHPAFLRASDRVMEHCLDELMSAAVEQARWAMLLLGEGRLEDLAVVGSPLQENELGMLAAFYPLFGIDVECGGFRCIPLPIDRDGHAVARAVAGSEALAERCVRLLVAQGRLERAGRIATFLSAGARLRLYGKFPDVFADAANDGSIAQSLRAISMGDGVDYALRPGLARLARVYGLAHDVPTRLLPEMVYRYAGGTSTGALRALRIVLGYWKGFGGVRDGVPGDEGPAAEEMLGSPLEGEANGILERLLGVTTPSVSGEDSREDEDVYDIETVVASLGGAGLQGDQKTYHEQLRRLCRLIPFSQGGLAAAVYAAHAAFCGFLCDRPETVLAWIEPLAAQAAKAREDPRRVGTVSDALLTTMGACARFLVEKPSAKAVAADALASIRAARLFFEERAIEPGAAVMAALEAGCLVLSGFEQRAEPMLRTCQARWSVQGNLIGQLYATYGLCAVGLSQDAVNQAGVYAQTAEALSQRLGLRRGVWLARLFESAVAIRGSNGPDLDRRLLEATIRQSSLYPGVSLALNIELGLLYAAANDGPSARDIFQSVHLFGRPSACRLLVMAVRGLGRERACVLDLLPRSLRHEYESLRPSSVVRRAVMGDDQGVVPSLLGLPHADKALAIEVFGSFKVTINGHSIADTDWGRRKARLLLVLLALRPEEPIARNKIIEALWGTEPTALARNNLNTALSSLRSTLGQKSGGCEYVISAGGSLGLNPQLVDTDVQRFEHLARTVLSHRSGTERLELLDACSTLEHLYREGVATELGVLPRLLQDRLDELKTLFVDCMVLGSGLAVEEGDAHLALWFARGAARVGGDRENVQRALARANKALEEREQHEDDHGERRTRGECWDGAELTNAPVDIGEDAMPKSQDLRMQPSPALHGA